MTEVSKNTNLKTDESKFYVVEMKCEDDVNLVSGNNAKHWHTCLAVSEFPETTCVFAYLDAEIVVMTGISDYIEYI